MATATSTTMIAAAIAATLAHAPAGLDVAAHEAVNNVHSQISREIRSTGDSARKTVVDIRDNAPLELKRQSDFNNLAREITTRINQAQKDAQNSVDKVRHDITEVIDVPAPEQVVEQTPVAAQPAPAPVVRTTPAKSNPSSSSSGILAGVSPSEIAMWDRLAQCESSGNWSINTGNGFYGGLQFTPSSWIAAGGGKYASRPDFATREQQIATARVLRSMQTMNAWPACSRKIGAL